MRLLKYRHAYRSAGTFRGWLYSLARHAAFDHLERRGAERARRVEHRHEAEDGAEVDFLESFPTAEPSAHESLERNQEAALLRRALDELPAEKRAVLVMSRYRDLRYEEIAEILGTSVGAIKVPRAPRAQGSAAALSGARRRGRRDESVHRERRAVGRTDRIRHRGLRGWQPGGRRARRDFDVHLETCASCRAELDEAREGWEELAALESVAIDDVAGRRMRRRFATWLASEERASAPTHAPARPNSSSTHRSVARASRLWPAVWRRPWSPGCGSERGSSARAPKPGRCATKWAPCARWSRCRCCASPPPVSASRACATGRRRPANTAAAIWSARCSRWCEEDRNTNVRLAAVDALLALAGAAGGRRRHRRSALRRVLGDRFASRPGGDRRRPARPAGSRGRGTAALPRSDSSATIWIRRCRSSCGENSDPRHEETRHGMASAACGGGSAGSDLEPSGRLPRWRDRWLGPDSPRGGMTGNGWLTTASGKSATR